MVLSNSDSFTQTEIDLITDSLCMIGVYRPGTTVSTNDLNICSNYLNKVVKYWDTKGTHMWTTIEGTLFLRPGVSTYTLSPTSSDQAGNNTFETTLTQDASASSLVVTDTSGMHANDNIGIELDNNTRQWSTIVSVDSLTQVTIAATLTSNASSGNTVFSYAAQCSKPLHISKAVNRDKTGTDKIMYIKSRDEFLMIPNKLDQNSYINYMFWTSNRTDGQVIVWPTPDNCATRIKFNYTRMMYDLITSTDELDCPSEWLHLFTLALTVAIAPIYGKDLTKVAPAIIQEYQECAMQMEMWDINGGSVKVVPNYRDDC